MNKINNWMKMNKLTINYKESCFMVFVKTHIHTTNFKLFINYNHIELKNHVKYFGMLVHNQLSWKNHIDFLHNKLSKVCGMIYKLRHYVPCKIVIYPL